MAKKLTGEYAQARNVVLAAMDGLTAKLGKLEDDVADLERQKVALAAEVASAASGLEPLRAERDGQLAEVQRAIEAARQANIELERVTQALATAKEEEAKAIRQAKANAEAQYGAAIAEMEARLLDLTNRLAKKQAEFDAFMGKFVKA